MDYKFIRERIKEPFLFYCKECKELSVYSDEVGKAWYTIPLKLSRDNGVTLKEAEILDGDVDDSNNYDPYLCNCGDPQVQVYVDDKVFDVVEARGTVVVEIPREYIQSDNVLTMSTFLQIKVGGDD